MFEAVATTHFEYSGLLYFWFDSWLDIHSLSPFRLILILTCPRNISIVTSAMVDWRYGKTSIGSLDCAAFTSCEAPWSKIGQTIQSG